MASNQNYKNSNDNYYSNPANEEIVLTYHKQQKNKLSLGVKLLIIFTAAAVILYLVYVGIKMLYPLSQGQVFRLWFSRTLPIVLLAILQCLTFLWLCILSQKIKTQQKKSLLKRIALWLIGVVVIFAMALGAFMHILNDDSEHCNENGTITVMSPIWLDRPIFTLYQKENFLVLQYLRNANGPDDIDPAIDQKPAVDNPNDTNTQKNNTDLPPAHNNNETQDLQESEKTSSIDEGYQKIYDTYLKVDNIPYTKKYTAKGNSYIIIYENEMRIRYLMYSGDTPDETKAQYVDYQTQKKPNGSWTLSDAEILNMYQYDYKTKEVISLEKTSW